MFNKKLLHWNGGQAPFKFDPSKAVFTPKMAKRNSAGPFAAGVMVQGTDGWDGDT